MVDQISIFWPGDYRQAPNDLARPLVEKATLQLESALDRLGKKHRRIEGFISKPDEAVRKLRPIDDPLIGLYTHWVYGPHTVDGVTGKDNPLLMMSNFDGQFPGLVGLLNTGACLSAEGRRHSRAWTEEEDWTADQSFIDKLEAWCSGGHVSDDASAVRQPPSGSAEAKALAAKVAGELRANWPLIMMLGDTSMGMTNGYFGARTLHQVGFLEHKVDQAWIVDYGKRVTTARIDDALSFVKDRGAQFHWGVPGAEDFTEDSTREQLRDYLAVLDLCAEFGADCVGWQYQLGLIHQRPPSDFAEGLLNSVCRPEGNGDTIVDATEADQGNVVPMELMKRLLKAKGLHQSVAFHDVRWGIRHEGQFLWVLLNSGSAGSYAFNHDPESLVGVHSYRQPKQYFPTPGGTFAGESKAGEITWARAWLDDGVPMMDVGQGSVHELPKDKLHEVWNGTTPEWPIMMADMGIGRDTMMAHFQSNHVAVAYGDIFDEIVHLSGELGFKVRYLKD
ncbi:MAG: fucose isomerase [Pseudomonadota bacterium]